MNIFLSTPIAGFCDELEYKEYRRMLLKTYRFLCKEHGKENVFAAFFAAKDYNAYDSPSKSAREDIDAIESCDIFIMFYPRKTPTSALVELGYALAKNKKILIISPEIGILPYMVQGFFEAYPRQVKWLNSIDNTIIEDAINSL